jgi:hypothetical protein
LQSQAAVQEVAEEHIRVLTPILKEEMAAIAEATEQTDILSLAARE